MSGYLGFDGLFFGRSDYQVHISWSAATNLLTPLSVRLKRCKGGGKLVCSLACLG